MNTIRSKETILQLYNHLLPDLATAIHQGMGALIPLFHDFNLEKVVDTWTKEPGVYYPDPISIENGNIEYMGLQLRLEGFLRPGVLPFDLYKELVLKLGHKSYGLGGSRQDIWLEKAYGQAWTKAELEEISERWCAELVDDLTQRLERLI